MAQDWYLMATILGANGLRPAKRTKSWGKAPTGADPYCICEIPGKPESKFQTKVAENELNPTWNHKDEVEEYVPGDPLHFKVHDRDRKGIGELLGQVVLEHPQFCQDGFEGELKLSDSGEDFGTVLMVKIEWVPVSPTSPQDAKETKASDLFDQVDLDGDGRISKEEYEAAVAAGVIPAVPPLLASTQGSAD